VYKGIKYLSFFVYM